MEYTLLVIEETSVPKAFLPPQVFDFHYMWYTYSTVQESLSQQTLWLQPHQQLYARHNHVQHSQTHSAVLTINSVNLFLGRGRSKHCVVNGMWYQINQLSCTCQTCYELSMSLKVFGIQHRQAFGNTCHLSQFLDGKSNLQGSSASNDHHFPYPALYQCIKSMGTDVCGLDTNILSVEEWWERILM